MATFWFLPSCFERERQRQRMNLRRTRHTCTAAGRQARDGENSFPAYTCVPRIGWRWKKTKDNVKPKKTVPALGRCKPESRRVFRQRMQILINSAVESELITNRLPGRKLKNPPSSRNRPPGKSKHKHTVSNLDPCLLLPFTALLGSKGERCGRETQKEAVISACSCHP